MKSALAAMAVTCVVMAAGCSPHNLASGDLESGDTDTLQVVTTTGILADLVRNVAGDNANVAALVPTGADPHSYEPTLRDVRNIVYADVAFSNYAMLEEHNLIKTLDANINPDAPNVGLAEGATKYSAHVIPLVEDVSLDTVWLGLRVSGAGTELGADRTSEVRVRLTEASGPEGSTVHGFLTQALGTHTPYFDTSNGLDATDVATLPTNAHTHLSWAFNKPGIYHLTFDTGIAVDPESSTEQPVARGTYTFAVGVDPRQIPELSGKRVIDSGHADLTTDLDTRTLGIVADKAGEKPGEEGKVADKPSEKPGTREAGYTRAAAGHDTLTPDQAVITVTNKAWQEIPRGARFVGPAGSSTYLLPQAVLGKHVHGEIDPHLWHDVGNVIAYVKLIRDTLAQADPAHAQAYADNAKRYMGQLDAVDAEVGATIASIPPERRHLVTTHDAFGYLGAAYGIDIAGFVTPNPSTEPSVKDRIRLSDTIRNLRVPAVFVEPQLAERSPTLREVAAEAGIRVCPIYSDAFDDRVHTYIDLMRFNAQSLKGCLQ